MSDGDGQRGRMAAISWLGLHTDSLHYASRMANMRDCRPLSRVIASPGPPGTDRAPTISQGTRAHWNLDKYSGARRSLAPDFPSTVLTSDRDSGCPRWRPPRPGHWGDGA